MSLIQFKRGSGKKLTLILTYLSILILISILATLLYHQKDNSKQFPELNKNDRLEVDAISDKDKEEVSNRKTEQCDTIHIALVCGGFNSTKNFYVLLKSILFYRTDKIHLHLLVDNISRTILTELFRTWRVSDLTIEFYNVTDHEQEISWITSQHYSHRFGLMKLVFLSVLAEQPKNLSNVIFLDSDMLFLGNAKHLWSEFANMRDEMVQDDKRKPIFGMVENQSDWYLGDSSLSGTRSVWPALGRGFNSGLILVDLIELKRQNWRAVWRQTAELELASQLVTSLADQDIFNAVIRLHSHIVHELPCYYNVQLNDHTNLNDTCFESSQFKLIHWNSPYKFSTKNSKANYFKNWYLTFRNWDAKLLDQSYCGDRLIMGSSDGMDRTPVRDDDRISQLAMNDGVENNSSNEILSVVCKEIRPKPQEKLRTFLYFMEFELEQTDCDVSLVVHLSLDRLRVLDELAAHWQGPISAAIYLSELETNLLLESIEVSSNLAQRKNIGYHLVFRDHGFNYPINRLRNIALNQALTPYVFLSDIDFLPSFNLYEYLKRSISAMKNTREDQDPLTRRALVIPAFENIQYKFEFPSSKVELLTKLNLGSISMFRDQIWPRGQAPTNYAQWKVSTKPYRVEWQPEYEPFVVASRSIPRFDERFVGFGWNKVENVMQLAALNYEFLVMPEAFVIHKFHSASYDIMKHRESVKYRACIRYLRKTFLKELRAKYPEFFTSIKATSQQSAFMD